MSKFLNPIRAFVFGNKITNDKIPDGPVDFEDAIIATKFGKYNVLLMIFAFTQSLAFISDTTALSYVIPSAECDLNLSLLDKGLLNAITHGGMICSAFLVGYLADTSGRKMVMFGGHIVDALCNIALAFSHSFTLSLFLKFIAGFFVGGTSALQVTMMAEFHAARFRPMIIMFIGVTLSFTMLTIPLVAMFILPTPFSYTIGGYEFYSWQLFLAVTSLPSVICSLWVFFIPESPKFLVSKNRTDEALAIMKKMYVMNTGKSEDTFPVKELKSSQKVYPSKDQEIQEIVENTENEGAMAALEKGIRQMKPLFIPPYVFNLLLLFIIQFANLSGLNSLRLWLPQLFKMMTEYQENGSLCDMISLGNKTIIETPLPEDGICVPIHVNPTTYTNSMIVAAVQIFLGSVASLTINFFGKRRMLVTVLISAGTCCLSLYWCADMVQATALAAITVGCTSVAINTTLTIIVDLFPTSLRAMAISLVLTIGRIGSISGNLMFPALLAIGCLPPFLTFGCILMSGGLLGLLIPDPLKHET